MKTNLISELLKFLKKEEIEIKLRKISDFEFWLESPDKSITANFVINNNTREILYDIFSVEHDVHLKEEKIRDVEKIDFIAEEHKKWKLVETVEDFWLILDENKLWAQKNQYQVKEKEMINKIGMLYFSAFFSKSISIGKSLVPRSKIPKLPLLHSFSENLETLSPLILSPDIRSGTGSSL